MQPRRKALVWLVVSQALYALSLVPWVFVAGMAVMAFDAPGSTEMLAPWLFVGAVWSYPLWLLVLAIVAWVLYAKKRLRGAVIATSVPLAGFVVLGVLLFAAG